MVESAWVELGHHDQVQQAYGSVVIYHADCQDGLFAAYVVSRHLGSGSTNLYIAHHNDASLSDTVMAMVAGKPVHIVDTCFTPAETDRLAASASVVHLIDHHRSNLDRFADYYHPKVRTSLSPDHSACVLAWQYYFGHDPVPWPLLYVEDRDLWRWVLPDSQAINASLALGCGEPHGGPGRWQAFEEVCHAPGPWEGLLNTGKVCLLHQEQQVYRLVRLARAAVLSSQPTLAVNTSVLHSEVCHQLLQMPTLPSSRLEDQKPPIFSFAACWHQLPNGKFKWSVRSQPPFDVLSIARHYGGGGHPCAAGFVTETLDSIFV